MRLVCKADHLLDAVLIEDVDPSDHHCVPVLCRGRTAVGEFVPLLVDPSGQLEIEVSVTTSFASLTAKLEQLIRTLPVGETRFLLYEMYKARLDLDAIAAFPASLILGTVIDILDRGILSGKIQADSAAKLERLIERLPIPELRWLFRDVHASKVDLDAILVDADALVAGGSSSLTVLEEILERSILASRMDASTDSKLERLIDRLPVPELRWMAKSTAASSASVAADNRCDAQTLDLTVARTDVALTLAGRTLAVLALDGTASIRLRNAGGDLPVAAPMDIFPADKWEYDFTDVILTHIAQPGKWLTLYAGWRV